MPRTNNRSTGPERDVAARVQLERERLGVSGAELARRMTQAGCPIDQSAISRIEQGDPPRRITVDELVAFAQVFGVEVQELLLPAHAARENAIGAAYGRLTTAALTIGLLGEQVTAAVEELDSLIKQDLPEADLRWANEAAQDFIWAHDNLQMAVSNISDRVLEALRSGDQGPRTSDLKFRHVSAAELRAAEAAAPRKASRGVPPRKDGPT